MGRTNLYPQGSVRSPGDCFTKHLKNLLTCKSITNQLDLHVPKSYISFVKWCTVPQNLKVYLSLRKFLTSMVTLSKV